MNGQFSSKLRGKAYQGIFIAAAIAFAFGSIASLPGILKLLWGSGDAVVVVNGLGVDYKSYQRAVIMAEYQNRELRQRFGAMAPMIFKMQGINEDPRQEALESLVTQKVILSVAEKMGLSLSVDYVREELQRPGTGLLARMLPEGLLDKRGAVLQDRLRLWLQRQGLTMVDFERQLEDQLVSQRLIALVQDAAQLPDCFKRQIELQVAAPRRWKLVRLNFSALGDLGAPSVDELKAYFEMQNSQARRYWGSERRQGTLWTFRRKAYEAARGDSEDKFSDRFRKDTQHLLASAGSQVTEFGQKYNGTRRLVESAELSGEQKLQERLNSLQERERISWVDGDTGYVLSLDKLHPAQERPFESVRAAVEQDLKLERLQKAAIERLGKEGSEKEQGVTSSTISWAPGEENKGFGELKDLGMQVERALKMVVVGQVISGVTKGFAYRLQLTECQEPVAGKGRGEIERLIAAQENENRERIVYDFIASSRENATITMNAKMLERGPSEALSGIDL